MSTVTLQFDRNDVTVEMAGGGTILSPEVVAALNAAQGPSGSNPFVTDDAIATEDDITAHNADAAAHADIRALIAALAGGSTIPDWRLIEWTESKAYQMLVVTYDVTYPSVIASATVQWPDGSSGVLTITSFDAAKLVELGFTLTHVASGKTVTQAAVTLNAYGFVITKPALTVA